MEFFKHYCGAHRGESLCKIYELGGHRALSVYWILVSICAEKLPKESIWTAAESDCVFTFHRRYLQDELRIKPRCLEDILRIFSECSQLSFTTSGQSIEIMFPKLLKSLDRGRKPRAIKTEIGCIDKDKDKDKDVDEDAGAQKPPPTNFKPQEFIHPTIRQNLASDEVSNHFLNALSQIGLERQKRYIPEIRKTFEDDLEKFADWINSVADSADAKCKTAAERTRYITASLLREVGVRE